MEAPQNHAKPTATGLGVMRLCLNEEPPCLLSLRLNILRHYGYAEYLERKDLQSLDTRLEILESFNNLSLEGDKHFESKGGCDVPKLFWVWRPTSSDAIRK